MTAGICWHRLGVRLRERCSMLGTLIRDIHATLQEVEFQPTLWDERYFVTRRHALEVLQRHVLERLENVMYVHGYRQELADLHVRAVQLQQRLEAVNARLFLRLREQLRMSSEPGPTLRYLCETYVGQEQPVPMPFDSDEDDLDIFMNGILGLDQIPAETRALQSGMIGYVPTPARAIFALLDHLRLQANDVFYDVGSGLGRVALLVGLLTKARAKGIEVEPAYCLYAQQRAASLGLTRVTFLSADAREADYTDGTAFFLYTPCTGRMFQEVLDRLYTEGCRRPITLATYGLCTEHAAQQHWLQPTGRQIFAHNDVLALFTNRKGHSVFADDAV